MSDQTKPNETLFEGRIPLKEGTTIRQHSARGTAINAAFVVGVNTIGLLRGFVVAGFLATDDYGIFGILVVTIGMLFFLKNFGIADRYVQQSEEDQEVEFQKAFTLEAGANILLLLILLAVVPIVEAAYDDSRLFAPGLALVMVLPIITFQFPLWTFYRRMEFAKQRLIQAVEPIVGFVVAVALAIAGAGYWALVLGYLSGALVLAILSVIMNPYKLRLRYERGTLKRYWEFSWPLFLNGLTTMLVAQAMVLVGRWEVGVAGIGAITLANNISQYTDRVDGIITGTLYPGICAVADRTKTLFEIFTKSNRLTLMWGIPFGVALSLFAADLVHFGIGDQWEDAIFVLQVYGLAAAAAHVGFNWHAFYRARGNTRPIAVQGVLVMGTMLAATIPLTLTLGIKGYALGVATSTVMLVIVRSYYLARLFDGFAMWRHMLRAVKPTIPAAGAILALRAAESGSRTLIQAIAELALYLSVTVAATWYFERPLLKEAVGYFRRAPAQAPA